VWIRSCGEWDTGEAVKKQSQFGGLTKLDGEADETRDDHGRDGRGTHGRSRPCYGTPCGVTPNRTSAPNKPNLGKSHFKGKRCADKDLQCIGRGESPHKTKPIPLLRIADGGWSRIGSPARALLPRACMGRLYKQTQFTPLCRSGDRRSQGPIVRNEANFPRTAMGRDRQGATPPTRPAVQTNPICRQGQRLNR
jgi:hypothetical protein